MAKRPRTSTVTTGSPEAVGKPPTTPQERPPSTEVVSVRIPGDEFQQLYDLATWKGESVAALVRRAVVDWLEGGEVALLPSVEVWSGARMLTVRHSYGGSFTEAIPDFPPATVQGPSSETF
jgi:hypothetical protein